MLAVVAQQFRRHGLHLAAVKHIQQQRLQNIVAMMTQGDFVCTELFRYAINNAAAQARTQAAGRFSLGDYTLDDAIGILIGDVELYAVPSEIVRGRGRPCASPPNDSRGNTA